jgi:uncharacterized protein YqgC (DUF456 family)
MIDLALLLLLILIAVAGVLLAALQLPGTWLLLAAAVGYDWYYSWQRIGWKWLLALAAVAVVAEVTDSLASLIAARRAGASRRAAVGALLGGFAGMILLSVPVPLIGTIVGGLIGCFLGALLAELTVRDDLRAGARVGVFATLGRLAGMASKIAAALVIAGVTLSLGMYAGW